MQPRLTSFFILRTKRCQSSKDERGQKFTISLLLTFLLEMVSAMILQFRCAPTTAEMMRLQGQEPLDKKYWHLKRLRRQAQWAFPPDGRFGLIIIYNLFTPALIFTCNPLMLQINDWMLFCFDLFQVSERGQYDHRRHLWDALDCLIC